MAIDALIEAFAKAHGVDRDRVDELVRDALAGLPEDPTWLQAQDHTELNQVLTTQGLALDGPDDVALDPIEDDVTDEVPLDADGQPIRYRQIGPLGRGGMGEVVRVYDRVLQRIVAMKLLREDLVSDARAVERFLAEAQATSQLEHPGIVPIYDLGRLPDMRPYFTMKEIRGRTLATMIREREPIRRMLEVFRVTCEAVAYAHSRGLLHRDIKPDNILVGAFGEVLVVDWGLASRVGPDPTTREVALERVREQARDLVGREAEAESLSSGSERSWRMAGTPTYMAPEVARGDAVIGPEADVYALGATLYCILTGRRPYVGPRAVHVLAQVIARPPLPPRGPHIDEELSELCEQAMAREAPDRPTAQSLARSVVGWLDGESRRARALQRVEEAERLAEEARRLRAEADARIEQAQLALAGVPAHAPEEAKYEGWALQDEAEALRQRAQALDIRQVNRLRLAVVDVPNLAEAHDRLAAWFRARHAEAERAGDQAEAARLLALLGDHDRGEYAAYREGVGALTLHTDPPGARVTLFRMVEHRRRLVPEKVGELGRTPLDEVAVPMGSYLLTIEAYGREVVRYPLSITRQEHFDGVPPSGADPLPVVLPPQGSVGPHERYIPAGWYHAGGDREAVNALPYQRVWVDAFVMARDPVTVGEYLTFLNDLVVRGREEEAERLAPRQRSGALAQLGPLLVGRDREGRFVLVPDSEGDVWEPDWPVMMVDWYGAATYARWLAARTGLPWRLPVELEWEKAARGGDRRNYPWGDFADPSWCANQDAFPGRSMPVPVGTFRIDTSVYGVRGMAGNARDWLGDPEGGPRIVAGRAVVPSTFDLQSLELRPRRGGVWYGGLRSARITSRDILDPRDRNFGLGFRLARSFPG